MRIYEYPWQCATNGTFRSGGAALTDVADSSTAHTHRGIKGNKLKRRRERERDARHYQSEYKKIRRKVGGNNNLKL